MRRESIIHLSPPFAHAVVMCILCLIGILLVTCQSDNFESLSANDIVEKRSSSKVIDIGYDMEIFTYFRASDEIETDQDIIASTPHIEAQSVKLKLFEDGSTYLEIIRQEPSQRVELIEKPSPDPRPKWHRILYDNGTLSTYDEQGSQLHDWQVPMADQKALVDSLIAQTGGPFHAVLDES